MYHTAGGPTTGYSGPTGMQFHPTCQAMCDIDGDDQCAEQSTLQVQSASSDIAEYMAGNHSKNSPNLIHKIRFDQKTCLFKPSPTRIFNKTNKSQWCIKNQYKTENGIGKSIIVICLQNSKLKAIIVITHGYSSNRKCHQNFLLMVKVKIQGIKTSETWASTSFLITQKYLWCVLNVGLTS